MKAHEHFLHFFTPRHTNNHRPKILHISGLTFCIAFLIAFQLLVSVVHFTHPEVLGYATNINISDLLSETNSRRSGAGVGSLSLNDQLNNAASGKASDMFQNQYWAHTSPQGKEPWAFITGAGYSYVFAGENLARDFGDSRGVVDAWMNSPSHKENLLNSRFQDVGFAIVNGKYGDSETTLVVQMFGAKSNQAPQIAAVINTPTPAPTVAQTAIPTENPTQIPSPTLTPTTTASPAAAPVAGPVNPVAGAVIPVGIAQNPKFDILGITKNVALGLTLMLLGVLAVDAILVYRRKTLRISGHNVAHMMMLIVVLAAITLLGRGLVL